MLKRVLLAGASLAVFGGMNAAYAGGNIILTGHDNDFHYNYGENPGNSGGAGLALSAELSFVRNGSTLPVLTFDAGTELTAALTGLGVSYVNVNPSSAANVTASLFNHATYSAFVVASVTSCGGCDNTPADINNITAQSAAIAAFFNNGGGILGLAGAHDTSAYAYVPEAAANGGGNPPPSGFKQTAFGASIGVPAVNGNPTHNYFGTTGSPSYTGPYSPVELNGSNIETIGLKNGTISCTGTKCTISTGVPEPVSLSLLATGLIGLGVARRRRRRA